MSSSCPSKCTGTSINALPENLKAELQETAKRIATPGKGILAADESMSTIGKRFAELGIDNTDENRRQYRQMLFNNDTLGDYVSGVILHEETLSQKDDKGDSLVDLLKAKSIIPGIKVDKGLGQLGGTRAETSTQGLDGLKERCDAFYKAGCRFAKWRAVLRIGDCEPSAAAIKENAHGLARYASICQHSGLVPIVEPEVLSDGAHDIDKCKRVSQRVYTTVFKALADYHVLLEGILLKPNMVTGGHDGPKASASEVGHLTVVTLRRTVPPAVPGIMFLSGGQSEEEATANLNAINKDPLSKPWTLSFSFGRALQTSAMHAWAGKSANVAQGQQELMNRLKANSLASLGKYTEGAVPASHMANKSNYVAKHTY